MGVSTAPCPNASSIRDRRNLEHPSAFDLTRENLQEHDREATRPSIGSDESAHIRAQERNSMKKELQSVGMELPDEMINRIVAASNGMPWTERIHEGAQNNEKNMDTRGRSTIIANTEEKLQSGWGSDGELCAHRSQSD